MVATLPHEVRQPRGPADVLGAVLVTSGLMSVVYAINKSIDHGWTSATTMAFSLHGAVPRVRSSPVNGERRHRYFRCRCSGAEPSQQANIVAVLVWERVLRHDLPGLVVHAAGASISAIQTGVGAYIAIAGTVVVVALGLEPARRAGGSWCAGDRADGGRHRSYSSAEAPADAAHWPFLDFARRHRRRTRGMALQVAAFIGVEQSVAGLAGGMVETSREVGGAVGVAIVATVRSARRRRARIVSAAASEPSRSYFTAGFEVGRSSPCFAIAALAAGLLLARPNGQPDLLRERLAGRTRKPSAATDDMHHSHIPRQTRRIR